MRKKFLPKVTTINGQISISFSLLLASIIACIIFSVIYLFSGSLTEQKVEIMHSTIASVSASIDSRISQLRSIAQNLRQDDTIQDSLQNKMATPKASQTLDQLYTYGLQYIVLITLDGVPLNPPLSSPYGQDEMLQMLGFPQYKASGREDYFSAPHAFPYGNPENDPKLNLKLTYYFTLRDQFSMEPYGTIQMIISKDSLFTDRTALIQSQFDHFYIIDGAGNLVYSDTGYEPCETLENAVSISKNQYDIFDTQINANEYFHYAVSSYPDWHIVGVASLRTITSNARLLTVIVILFGLMGIVLVTVLSLLISRRVTGPIQQLGRAMKTFESGAMPEKLDTAEVGEVGELIRGFNTMLDNIQSNIDTICQEQEEKKNAKVAALQYQLQSLQQQINPHFLYNTLNVISYLAMESRTDEIRSFVQALNQLLRATLSNSNETVTFRKEMTLLTAYAHLMEYRYKDMFSLEFDVEDNTLSCMVPKLILQPLVENALLHGIFPSGRHCTISVRACCVEGNLCVSVADDGVGIPKEKMFSLFDKHRGFSSIGLNNVNDRIKLCYSGNHGLMVSSQPGQGTIVAFYVPIQQEDEME